MVLQNCEALLLCQARYSGFANTVMVFRHTGQQTRMFWVQMLTKSAARKHVILRSKNRVNLGVKSM